MVSVFDSVWVHFYEEIFLGIKQPPPPPPQNNKGKEKERSHRKISFRKMEGCFISLNLFFNIDQGTLNGEIR